MQPGKRLVDKVAIVTGGASGIGAETARQFGLHGAVVVVADVNANLGRKISDDIGQAGGKATFRELDVSDEARWAELVAETEAEHGKLDILANIAGISGRTSTETIRSGPISGVPLEEQTVENWNRIMEINSTGVFLGTKHAIPAMRRAGGGSIINISSICGIVGAFANAAYHASKGAVRIFTKSAAVQYAADRIRVNSIHPGFIDTPMTARGHAEPAVREMRMAATPLGRFGTPYDIAMGCLYLASDEAAWITGAELVIDGGTTAA